MVPYSILGHHPPPCSYNYSLISILFFSLGPLVNKVKEFQVETIVDTLCSNMISDKEQLRDISSIGLKTVISELPPGSNTLVANICKKITGRLTNAISQVNSISLIISIFNSLLLSSLMSPFNLKHWTYSLIY